MVFLNCCIAQICVIGRDDREAERQMRKGGMMRGECPASTGILRAANFNLVNSRP
jgi:hypothetical protein